MSVTLQSVPPVPETKIPRKNSTDFHGVTDVPESAFAKGVIQKEAFHEKRLENCSREIFT
jgi:hypothetical protein